MKLNVLLLLSAVVCTTSANVLRGDRSLRQFVPNQYIVRFKQTTIKADKEKSKKKLKAEGKKVKDLNIINGFVVSGLDASEVDKMKADVKVKDVEQDQIATIVGYSQSDPPSWGLDRIDQCDFPLDNTYDLMFDGTGANVYILDTGIWEGHSDFGSRVIGGQDFVADVDGTDDYGTDCHGHGTHVAGSAAGSTYGVAKNAFLHAVRVLDCGGSGSYSGIINAIGWVVAANDGGIINMSLGGGFSAGLNDAVNNAVAAGVAVVVAAGNAGRDACDFSPASAADAITVAASDTDDGIASFSNYGSCVDIFAPGVGITSASTNCVDCTDTWSGTSMASPHVAGVVAQILEAGSSNDVKAQLILDAAEGAIHGINRRILRPNNNKKPKPIQTPNYLLQTHRADVIDQCGSSGVIPDCLPKNAPCPVSPDTRACCNNECNTNSGKCT